MNPDPNAPPPGGSESRPADALRAKSAGPGRCLPMAPRREPRRRGGLVPNPGTTSRPRANATVPRQRRDESLTLRFGSGDRTGTADASGTGTITSPAHASERLLGVPTACIRPIKPSGAHEHSPMLLTAPKSVKDAPSGGQEQMVCPVWQHVSSYRRARGTRPPGRRRRAGRGARRPGRSRRPPPRRCEGRRRAGGRAPPCPRWGGRRRQTQRGRRPPRPRGPGRRGG